MWLLLEENISNNFIIENKSTYLLKLDKTNFLVGKNNSGKSYFLRFLLRNAIKIYKDDDELFEDIKNVILKKDIEFSFFENFNSEKVKNIVDKYSGYINVLNKANDSKVDNGSRYIGVSGISYQYPNEKELFQEMIPLFEYLKISPIKSELDIKIIPRYKSIKDKIKEDFKQELNNILAYLSEEEIIRFGIYFNDFTKDNKISKYYFPILRSIRHPLKDTKNVGDINTKSDIYKDRINSEYSFDEDINIVTGLDFYQDYKNNLLGSKEKREKINKFEKFLSNYFFNGENISIIPDEETFELKININDNEDRFIYQVGDGITSLLIIMYKVFMEYSVDEYKLFFIEEPENNFHPGFQRLFINMITYFKEFQKCIFIITTHSNHLIDIGNRENKNSLIYLCKKEKGTISVCQKDYEYYDVLEELGVTFSSVLIANKVIWVEGKYDAFYIRLLLNLKNINIQDTNKYIEDYDYCFIPYGGKNMTLIDFESNNSKDIKKEFIAKAKKINPKYMVILDDDNMFEENKTSKKENYMSLKRALGGNIYKLNVREIENLFPKEVVEKYIKQGIKNELCNEQLIEGLKLDYVDYKDRKLGEYINEKLMDKIKGKSLRSITGREDGFLKKGFLYDKAKFYKCVVEWAQENDFNYEEKVTDEAKQLINAVETFIKSK